MIFSRCLVTLLGMGMATSTTYGQALFAPRATAMMAYGSAVRDTRGFTANPAGLTGIRDWDLNTVTAINTPLAGHGFVFSGFGFGKRFLDRHAIAVQYSPGTSLDIIQPATLVVVGLNIPADKTISYAEPFAAAYALRLNEEWSVGIQARVRTEKVNDPQYTFQLHDSTIVTTEKASTATTWFTDLAMLWKPAGNVAVGAVARGLIRFSRSGLDSAFARFTLPQKRSLDVSVSYAATPSLTFVAGASTAKEGSLGVEWAPAGNLMLRGGVTGNADEHPVVSAVAAGIGWSYAFLELDAAYLAFTNQANRRGSVSASAFDAGVINNIAMSPYAANRVAFSVKAILGNLKESLARIEGVEMLGGIYPSAYEALAFRPVGKVKVRNISKKPIQARATFFVERFMDQPTETQAVYIPPGEDAEIPLTAVFNELVKAVPKMTVRDGTVSVSATVAEDFDDRTQTRVLIHGKNDWDGNVLSLRYFVTPDDPEIIRYSRDILLQKRDSLAEGPKELTSFRNAKILFNAFAGKLSYVADPKQSADFVQYPSETLKIRGGDCDDMAVCFASLLSSIGISTAFVDVIPPGQPDNAHIFLLCDTGVDPKFGASVADNPKRYVVRKGKSGAESIWLPIETTVITRGFDEAWTAGAQQYFDCVEVGLGLIKGWVRIVDVY
jgi:transglutaminase-like putative cysteine protease